MFVCLNVNIVVVFERDVDVSNRMRRELNYVFRFGWIFEYVF